MKRVFRVLAVCPILIDSRVRPEPINPDNKGYNPHEADRLPAEADCGGQSAHSPGGTLFLPVPNEIGRSVNALGPFNLLKFI